MSDAPKISLQQQIEECGYELDQRARVYPRLVSSGKLRQAVADYHVDRMRATRRTLEWLQRHEDEIKAFLALEPETRKAGFEMAAEIAKRAAIAAAGGPVR